MAVTSSSRIKHKPQILNNMTTKHLRVRYNDGRWEVIGSNASQPARVADTKSEAVDIAKEMVGPGNDKKYRVAIIEKKNGEPHKSYWAFGHRLGRIIQLDDSDLSADDKQRLRDRYEKFDHLQTDNPWLFVKSMNGRPHVTANGEFKHNVKEEAKEYMQERGLRKLSIFRKDGGRHTKIIHPLEKKVQESQPRRSTSSRGKTIGEYLKEHDYEAQEKYGTPEYTEKQERVLDFAEEYPDYTASQAAEHLHMRAAYIRKVLRRTPGY